MKQIHGGDVYTYEGMTDFSANINPLGPSERVVAAVRQAVAKIGQYPDIQCRQLRAALSDKIAVRAEHLVFGNGAADLIFAVVLAEKPRRALLLAPSFAEYKQALATVDCAVEYVYLREEEDFRLDEDYLEHLTSDLDVVFLCNPENPTGQVMDQELLLRIVEKCSQLQIRIVVDECFIDFVEGAEQRTLKDLVVQYPQLFILRAFTKMHAMPGVRLGFGICSDTKLLEQVEAVRQPWPVSVIAQAAGVAAVGENDRIARTRAFIRTERDWMERQFEQLGITFYPSAANYILLKSGYELGQLLKDYGLLIRDCSNYEGLEAGYYRVAVRTREENQKLIAALSDIYRKAGQSVQKG